jgi:LemA protein
VTTVIVVVTAMALAVLVGYVAVAYNRFMTQRNYIEESWRQIDVELKRRHDLIPNLVSTVQGAANFEQATLTRVIEARSSAISAAQAAPDSPAARATSENMLTGALKSLFALAESYPTLTAVAAFRDLQSEITDTEDRIASSRRLYNSNVRAFNTRLATVPSKFVAAMFSGSVGGKADYFEIEDAARPAPTVSFS